MPDKQSGLPKTSERWQFFYDAPCTSWQIVKILSEMILSYYFRLVRQTMELATISVSKASTWKLKSKLLHLVLPWWIHLCVAICTPIYVVINHTTLLTKEKQSSQYCRSQTALLLWLKRLNAIDSHDLPAAQPNSRALRGTSVMTWSPFEFGREGKRYRPPWCQRVFKHLSFYFFKKQTQLTCSLNTSYLQQRAMNVLGIHKSRLEFHLGGIA